MKLKKYLRKMAEIDADKLLNEKDEMYIQKMLQYQVPQSVVRRKFTQTTAFRAIIGSIVSAAILSVIIVPSVLEIKITEILPISQMMHTITMMMLYLGCADIRICNPILNILK